MPSAGSQVDRCVWIASQTACGGGSIVTLWTCVDSFVAFMIPPPVRARDPRAQLGTVRCPRRSTGCRSRGDPRIGCDAGVGGVGGELGLCWRQWAVAVRPCAHRGVRFTWGLPFAAVLFGAFHLLNLPRLYAGEINLASGAGVATVVLGGGLRVCARVEWERGDSRAGPRRAAGDRRGGVGVSDEAAGTVPPRPRGRLGGMHPRR